MMRPLTGSRLGSLEIKERAAEKLILEKSHLHFTAHFFKARTGQNFHIGRHHPLICRAMDNVLAGRCKRLIINVAPGFTKTETSVISLIAHGLALNPAARFVHLSYSDTLALGNSMRAKDILATEQYQLHWGVQIRKESSAKDVWETTAGGGVRATSTLGQVTGFRAGQMMPGFSGALIIDDPIKPADARYPNIRKEINNEYHRTVRSRLAHEDVPIIIIMQRLDEDDTSGFILKGGAGEAFDHLWLPAEIRPRVYPAEWTHGRLIPHTLSDGPLWPEKLDERALQVLRVDPKVYAAQYDQEPRVDTGDYFKAEWLVPVITLPPRDTLRVYGASDYAVTADGGDYTVHAVVGVDPDGNLWLLDLWRGQASSDVWVEAFCDLVLKWRPLDWAEETGQIRAGVGPFLDRRMRERRAYVTRKQFPTRGDKAVRAQSIRGRMALDGLRVPAGAAWRQDLVSELMRFPAGVHDDQVDALGLVGQLLDIMIKGRRPDPLARPAIDRGYDDRRPKDHSIVTL